VIARTIVRAVIAAAALSSVAAAGGRAHAAPATAPASGGLAELFRELGAALDAAIAERVPRPPVPVAVSWRDRRIGSIDLGAPLLAVAAADLDRDGRAELAALTTREVVVLAVRDRSLVEKARAPLGGEPAPVRPRDPVGVLAVDTASDGGTVLVARSSERADAVRLGWQKGRMVELDRRPGFPLCGGTMELVPGRNYFTGAGAQVGGERLLTPLPVGFLSVVCTGPMADARGGRIAVAAIVDLDRVLHVRCRSAAGGECAATVKGRDYDGVGVAAEIADIDNDGMPEVMTTRGGAPGDRDRVSVFSVVGGKVAKVYSKDFHAGVVGLGAGDLDGDGDRDVIVAVRFAGSHHVSFWTLN
jgi:hypothetical protein